MQKPQTFKYYIVYGDKDLENDGVAHVFLIMEHPDPFTIEEFQTLISTYLENLAVETKTLPVWHKDPSQPGSSPPWSAFSLHYSQFAFPTPQAMAEAIVDHLTSHGFKIRETLRLRGPKRDLSVKLRSKYVGFPIGAICEFINFAFKQEY